MRDRPSVTCFIYFPLQVFFLPLFICYGTQESSIFYVFIAVNFISFKRGVLERTAAVNCHCRGKRTDMQMRLPCLYFSFSYPSCGGQRSGHFFLSLVRIKWETVGGILIMEVFFSIQNMWLRQDLVASWSYSEVRINQS